MVKWGPTSPNRRLRQRLLGYLLDAAPPQPLVRRKRPLLATLLQLVFAIGGLGYVYLGQRKKAAILFVLVAVLNGAAMVTFSMDLRPPSRLLLPLIVSLQVLSALDGWRLAQQINQGKEISPSDTEVNSLTLLPAFTK